jgi:hypothetical protein
MHAALCTKLEALLEDTDNASLRARLEAMEGRREVVLPEPVQTGPVPADDSAERILAGRYGEVSVEALYQFLDAVRLATRTTEQVPLWNHGADCICTEHLGHQTLTDLVHLTRDNPAYGDSLLAATGHAWSPPAHESYGYSVNRSRMLIHVYLGVGFVLLILSWVLIVLVWKWRKVRHAPATTDAEAASSAVPPADETSGKFDLTRVDLFQ